MLDKLKREMEYHARKYAEVCNRHDALDLYHRESIEGGCDEGYVARIRKMLDEAKGDIDRHLIEIEAAKIGIEILIQCGAGEGE
jgi:hypothetical protein